MAEQQDLFQQAMNQGHSAAWDQAWDRAAGFYRQALQERPDHPQALTNLGLALIELQEFEEAMQCYLKAARAMPEDPLPLEKLTQLYERMGRLDQAAQASMRAAELYLKNKEVNKAIENWERVTRLNPENIQAHSRLALVLERLGDKQKAVSEYLVIASILQENGDLENAIRTVNQALKVVPNSDEAIYALSLLKDFKPLPKPARPRGGTAPILMAQVRQLQAPQETAPEKSVDPIAQACQKALTILAGMLFEAADDDQAGQSSRRGLHAIVTGTGLLRKPVDHTRMILHVSQVVDLQTRGEYALAADELQRAMDVGLEMSAAYFDLGYLHAQTGRLESAVRELQHSVKNVDFSLGAHLLIGDLLRKKGQPKEAAVEYMEALRQADAQMVTASQANDLRQLYEPLVEAQRHETDLAAIEHLCDNVHGLLMRPDWRAQLSRAREQLPKTAKGAPLRPLAEILTEARSGQIIEAITRINEISNTGNLRAAMEEAFYALDSAPTYLPLHNLMGELLVKQGNIPGAVNKLQVVARAYGMRGEPQPAIGLYRRVVELTPTDLNARSRLIDQLLASGQAEAATNEYMQLAEVYYSLADLNMARKVYTDALRAAQLPRVDSTLRIKILHRMADIDMQSLDWRQALRIYEQIRTLQPEDIEARANLIELNFRLDQEQQSLAELDNYLAFLSSNNQMVKAVSFLETLVAENPKRVLVRRRLADLYRHLGRMKEAILQLDAIGEHLMQEGDRNSAIQIIEMIISLNPPNRADYQRLMEQLRSAG
ncbi:MAG: tetratricopeptide repeat protein [Anaerolineales bacterium]|nr:tetratricopeptide repeat protein [Anaerolineales bacterium]